MSSQECHLNRWIERSKELFLGLTRPSEIVRRLRTYSVPLDRHESEQVKKLLIQSRLINPE